PYAAYLGSAFNPLFTTFQGKATAKITKTLTETTQEFDEPYVGISPDSYFAIGGETVADLTLDRLNRRESLKDQFEAQRRLRSQISGLDFSDPYREMAFSMIGSEKLRQA